MGASETAIKLAETAAAAASEKLAGDIVALDVSQRLALTDIFVIASAANEPQAAAIARNIHDRLAIAGHRPLRVEGSRQGEWQLLDYGEVVIHLMRADARSFYSLERLWKDCPRIDLGLDVAPVAAVPVAVGDRP